MWFGRSSVVLFHDHKVVHCGQLEHSALGIENQQY